MPDFKIAAAYIRVSTDDQVELSPDSQLAVLREYAIKNSMMIPETYVFVDEGISGRSASKRPAFNQMIATARDDGHPIDVILVWKFSRFARNQEESIFYKAMLRKAGVEVVSVSEPLIDGPFGSLIERILEWMDEYYSIRLSSEVKRSMTLNAQRGRRQIAAPFGYQLITEETGDKRMVPHPAEAKLVHDIYQWFLAGDGWSQIAKRLNGLGVTTHRGTPFENRTVEYIIRNPVYIGKIRWTPTGRARRDFNNPDTIVSDGDHKPIIDKRIWDAAQQRVLQVKALYGKNARPSYELKDWLGGIVRCSECGATLIFSKPHYFKCNNYVRGRCKSTQHITVEKLHAALIEKLNSDLHSSDPLIYEVTETDNADEIHRLELAIKDQDRRLRRVRDAYAAGLDSLEEYAKFRGEILEEQARLQKEIDKLRKRVNPFTASKAIRSALANALKIIEAPDATKEAKNEAARNVIHTCTFSKDSMTLNITYRLSI